MLLKDIPSGSHVYFIVGEGLSGKSAFINYLLGHEFSLENPTDLGEVIDQSKPHAKMKGHLFTGSPFEVFHVFETSDNTYICELPPIQKAQTKIEELKSLIAELNIDYDIIVLSSVFEWHGVVEDIFGVQWLSNWSFLLDGSSHPTQFVINSKGDTRYKLDHYLKKKDKFIQHNTIQILDQKRYLRTLTPLNNHEEGQSMLLKIGFHASSNEKMRRKKGREACLYNAAEMRIAVCEKSNELVRGINEENTVVWSEYNCPKAKEVLLKRHEENPSAYNTSNP